MGWKDEDRFRLIRELAAIVHEAEAIPVGSTIDVRAWEALAPDQKALFLDSTPYSVATMMLMGKIAKRFGDDERVSYVLDNAPRKQGQSRISKEFEFMRTNPESAQRWEVRLGDVSWDDSGRRTPLQAADYAAYEFSKAVATPQILGRSDRDVRVSSLILFYRPRSGGMIASVLIRQALREMVRELRRRGGLLAL